MTADRQELLRREEAAWSALLTAAERVPAELRTVAGVVPDWSVSDLVFHSGKYAELTGQRLEQMASGTFVDEEQPQEQWQAMNDGWAEESKSLTWEQSVAAAEACRAKARSALEALSEVDDTAASWFSDETFLHYAEHTDEIERFADST
ncbi:MAG: DinB family protein [Actinomycetota bacterium]|nr:DinB family protein [Actinomycetota bacterium]